MKLWKCSICGYVHEGETAPAVCPKCNAPQDKFVLMDESAAEKIYRSDKTNDLQMKLITLAMEMNAVAEAGIKDNLDPMCVHVFEYAKKAAWEVKQMAKAEIAGHVGKGKF
ncbi:rubredoxin [Clostridiaceae bacterium DONG20-135]|uniref:Rubredoxin n=1 Tax=Copranaerobaculum intestinale TaxID=2692629 RepID=A0A6N8U8X6_9FIRM|nr:rubredoxin [Copranaerobaculum intestinale]MXQ73173.1 rubredoxin [Copranaerobaculum intestinale]